MAGLHDICPTDEGSNPSTRAREMPKYTRERTTCTRDGVTSPGSKLGQMGKSGITKPLGYPTFLVKVNDRR